MKKQNILILVSISLFIIILLSQTNCNKLEKYGETTLSAGETTTRFNTCYATQSDCLEECVKSFTFIPNSTNKWVFYNGSVADSTPPTLTFTRYPNNVVEITSSTLNVASNCKGEGWLYFSLTDGVWKQGTTSLTTPPAFISSLTVDKPANGWNPSTRNTLKVTSEFPIIITENIRRLCVAGIGKFTPDAGTAAGSSSPFFSTCCPSLFFYIAADGVLNNPWLSTGSATTTYTIPPFVGRYQGGT